MLSPDWFTFSIILFNHLLACYILFLFCPLSPQRAIFFYKAFFVFHPKQEVGILHPEPFFIYVSGMVCIQCCLLFVIVSFCLANMRWKHFEMKSVLFWCLFQGGIQDIIKKFISSWAKSKSSLNPRKDKLNKSIWFMYS